MHIYIYVYIYFLNYQMTYRVLSSFLVSTRIVRPISTRAAFPRLWAVASVKGPPQKCKSSRMGRLTALKGRDSKIFDGFLGEQLPGSFCPFWFWFLFIKIGWFIWPCYLEANMSNLMDC